MTPKKKTPKRKNSKKNSEKKLENTPNDLKSHYRIIITSQNKILVCVYKAMNKKSSIMAFSKIITENKKAVRFPIRYSSRDHKLMESKYELLLMKSKSDSDTNEPLLRNNLGQLVPHIASNSKMIIYKKEEFLFEESFWVYGLNPKSQRKDFNYILNEMVLKNLPKVKYPIKTISVFKNKLIIQGDSEFEMVICKCENDSTRLYTEIEKELLKLRIKSVFFSGMLKGVARGRLEDKMLEKTGWTLEKVRRKSTRP